MRLHITLDDEVIAEVDKVAGPRRRSAFIVEAVLDALDQHRRLALLESAFGSIAPEGHVWDPDPAAWVRDERHADRHRGG